MKAQVSEESPGSTGKKCRIITGRRKEVVFMGITLFPTDSATENKPPKGKGAKAV